MTTEDRGRLVDGGTAGGFFGSQTPFVGLSVALGRPWYERDHGAARFPQVMYNFGRGFLLLSWLKKQR